MNESKKFIHIVNRTNAFSHEANFGMARGVFAIKSLLNDACDWYAQAEVMAKNEECAYDAVSHGYELEDPRKWWESKRVSVKGPVTGKLGSPGDVFFCVDTSTIYICCAMGWCVVEKDAVASRCGIPVDTQKLFAAIDDIVKLNKVRVNAGSPDLVVAAIEAAKKGRFRQAA